MFFRLYRYGLIRSSRDRMMIFWNLIFPLILGSLFHVAFGNYTDKEVLFHQVSVAYVQEEGADGNFALLLEALETENGLIQVQKTSQEKAEKLLREGEAEGIFQKENRGWGTKPGRSGRAGKLRDFPCSCRAGDQPDHFKFHFGAI